MRKIDKIGTLEITHPEHVEIEGVVTVTVSDVLEVTFRAAEPRRTRDAMTEADIRELLRDARTAGASHSRRYNDGWVDACRWIEARINEHFDPSRKCQIVQHSDLMVCETCGLRWDTNDYAPPPCPKIDERGL